MKKYNLLFASLLFLFPNETIAQERAIIKIDTDRVIDQINPHLYGNFSEHLGQGIYGGIYDPKSIQADEDGFRKDVIEQKFSALYNAFKFGAPPHAGIAPGVDRIVMLLAQEPNIREVIVFPMDRNARDILMGAPSEVTEKQLRDVHIKLDLPKEEEKSE